MAVQEPKKARQTSANNFELAYIPVTESGCWIWLKGTDACGYGFLKLAGKKYMAHRYSLSMAGVTVPPKSLVCHKCDTPSCVNPIHLYIGDAKTNTRDKMQRGRASCGRGERNGGAKLTVDQVRQIIADTRTQKEIAREFGIGQPHVSAIKNRKFWRGLI